MNNVLKTEHETWEGEGGAAPGLLSPVAIAMDGTYSQVEWALLIRRRVNDEFDRVAAAFQSIAARYNLPRRALPGD